MVYCGKASLSCQNCRTRRIKCDRAHPECTQCVRVGKKCPGYRDMLSVMFRDESTKVIQKAHAQWGLPEPSESLASSSSSSSSSSLSSPSTAASSSTSWSSVAGKGALVSRPATAKSSRPSKSTKSTKPSRPLPSTEMETRLAVVPVSKEIGPTTIERGVKFYIDNYLVGHPDEPMTAEELRDSPLLRNQGVLDMMAAVGLASLSNLVSDVEMDTLAREKYVSSLQQTAKAIRNVGSSDVKLLTKSVVMLAMFEVVRGNQEPSVSARAHIMGAAALIKSSVPNADYRKGFRGLLQVCFSMFVPCYVSGIPLPDAFFDMISASETAALPFDKPAAELMMMMTRFVQLAGFLRRHTLVDGRPTTTSMIREMLTLEAQLAAWEERLQTAEMWAFTVEQEDPTDRFPPAAVLQGCFHVYSSMWAARVWNHYRWTRLLANEILLDSLNRYPTSAAPLISPERRQDCFEAIGRMALDTLVGVPTHWRHPALSLRHRVLIQRTTNELGIGAAGIPTLAFYIKTAACASGVPRELTQWGLGILEAIWAVTGMLQCKALANLLRDHLAQQPAKYVTMQDGVEGVRFLEVEPLLAEIKA